MLLRTAGFAVLALALALPRAALATPASTAPLPASARATCATAMAKLCAAKQYNPGDCFVCLGDNQNVLKAAGCTASDFDSFCDPPPVPHHDCTTNLDCNWAGRCTVGRFGSRVCFCDTGWWGQHCEEIKFGVSERCGSGGMCLQGEQGFTSTWGGEAVQADDESWHLFAAGFAQNSNLSSWLQQSRVLHGHSSHGPQGPYSFVDVTLGSRSLSYWDGLTQHNPAVQRAADGTYLLFYMGSTQSPSAANVSGGVRACALHPRQNVSVCRQRIGLATAQSPAGPWLRKAEPILDVGPAGAWDGLFTTNPTPHAFANGSVLLIYKARSVEDPSKMFTGAAFAEHYLGPYTRLSARPINVSTTCEDAGIYYSSLVKVFRMVLHCGCSYQYLWSLDGVNWERTTPSVPWCNITYADGSTELLQRRERPKWVIDPRTGYPVAMLNGVMPSSSHEGGSFTLATKIDWRTADTPLG